ncbi:hypothetical protein WJX74_008272 [Apatococcus lobatus]|uniref:Uncharacterized protein n=1 Tax=Apatococcus lobatus TaxID=904363 RepID=A0AAW1QBQ3_9CHLO
MKSLSSVAIKASHADNTDEADNASVISEAVSTPDQALEPSKSHSPGQSNIPKARPGNGLLDVATTTNVVPIQDPLSQTDMQPITMLANVMEAQKQIILHPMAACLAELVKDAHHENPNHVAAQNKLGLPMEDAPKHGDNFMANVLADCINPGRQAPKLTSDDEINQRQAQALKSDTEMVDAA